MVTQGKPRKRMHKHQNLQGKIEGCRTGNARWKQNNQVKHLVEWETKINYVRGT